VTESSVGSCETLVKMLRCGARSPSVQSRETAYGAEVRTVAICAASRGACSVRAGEASTIRRAAAGSAASTTWSARNCVPPAKLTVQPGSIRSTVSPVRITPPSASICAVSGPQIELWKSCAGASKSRPSGLRRK
jgi:hypothetical protein